MSGDLALQIEDVTVTLTWGPAIVSDVSLEVHAGEVLGLVGESGSGKTTVSLAALGYARRGARIVNGRVEVRGEDVLGMSEPERVAKRGSLIAYVPQDPSVALNPSLRVEVLLSEMLRAHQYGGDWGSRITEVLEKVGLVSDKRFRRRFPHQLSGGQQQRLAIAMALICEPAVLVMDEPTTGLDVVTQALVLDEVKRLCRETGVATMYVSHDLAVVADVAHRIAVMYAGRVVEQGGATSLLQRPRHPYTRGLIESIPDHREPRSLRGIPGVAAGLGDVPGCAFAPRCAQASEACRVQLPALEGIGVDHLVRCIHWAQTPPVTPGQLRVPSEEITRTPLVEVRDLTAEHRTRVGTVVAASNVSFRIERQECVALVGESGSGKTTIARCMAGLHQRAGGVV
ncbi:MAG: oligopeptide/dipeptide ABC transporter ATP-binding protein, partial [Solirubrobacteraceae bacterium]